MPDGEKMKEYTEAFCFFQAPVPAGQKASGLLDCDQLEVVS